MFIPILFEDNHLLVVNKPAGLLVQGDETGDITLADQAKAYIKERYKKPGDVFLGIVHRLDRPVSGAVILARTSKALERMNALFAERKVEKKYWAVVKKRPNADSGILTNYLYKDTERNTTHVIDKPSRRHPDAKLSELKYTIVGNLYGDTVLEVEPATGRSHQIRAQLAHIGSPILGDLKYGYPTPNADASIHLHCSSMAWIHPVTKEYMKVVAPLPNEPTWKKFEPLLKDIIKESVKQ